MLLRLPAAREEAAACLIVRNALRLNRGAASSGRLAPRRWSWAGLALLLAAAGCSSGSGSDPDVQVECTIEPSPPAMGPASIKIALAAATGQPIAGASVHVEGNMQHAGMVPEMATAAEVSPGRYRASIKFTMAGDWFLLIEVELADGRKATRTIDVPNVLSR